MILQRVGEESGMYVRLPQFFYYCLSIIKQIKIFQLFYKYAGKRALNLLNQCVFVLLIQL